MKTVRIPLIVLLFIVVQSCCSPFRDCDDDFVEPVSRYEPVFLNRAEFENSVSLKNDVGIANSGKIYTTGDFLFINEVNKGFHVYDNSDPANPKSIRFLEVPGATDLAVRNDMMYINQATDLIAVTYEPGANTIALTKRIPNTFPSLRSPDGEEAYNTPENTVVIDWKLKSEVK